MTHKIEGYRWLVRALAIVLTFPPISTWAQVNVNVTTWHNDNWRTGQNTNESRFTTGQNGNVTENSFGLLCKIPLSTLPQKEQAYAQPLVVANSDGSMNVYLATMQDQVYVFKVPSAASWNNATSCSSLQYAAVNLLDGSHVGGGYPADACFVGNGWGSHANCFDPPNNRVICPSVGVLGTPVIDTSSNTMYLVTESQDNDTHPEGVNCNSQSKGSPGNFHHYVHALDLTSSTLAEKPGAPVSVPQLTQNDATFESKKILQRPGLLFLTNPNPASPTVYMGFSMMDGTSPHPSGWVLGYDGGNLALGGFPIDLATVIHKDTNRDLGGGIWQGGAGLAAGLDGNKDKNYIYLSTADGVSDSNNDYGDTFLKLNTDLSLASSYTPSDYANRWNNDHDLDFGSAGEMMVPDGALTDSHYKYIVIKGEKESSIWVLDRTNAGTVLQQVGLAPTSVEARGTAAFWSDGTNPFMYIAQGYTPLQQYKLNCSYPNGPICTPAASTTATGIGYGATPSVSSNGTSNGIVWAIRNNNGANPVLYAFDAENVSNELYDSGQCHLGGKQVDQPGTATRFSVPTVANGYVFIGTENDFDIYGVINPVRNCQAQ